MDKAKTKFINEAEKIKIKSDKGERALMLKEMIKGLNDKLDVLVKDLESLARQATKWREVNICLTAQLAFLSEKTFLTTQLEQSWKMTLGWRVFMF